MDAQGLAKSFAGQIEMALRTGEPSVWLGSERGLMFIAFPQPQGANAGEALDKLGALLAGGAGTFSMSMKVAGMLGEQFTGSIQELANKAAEACCKE